MEYNQKNENETICCTDDELLYGQHIHLQV